MNLNQFLSTVKAGTLSERIIQNTLEHEDDDASTWADRFKLLVKAYVPAIVHLRDHAGLSLTEEVFFSRLELPQLLLLTMDRSVPKALSDEIVHYLVQLPGWNWNNGAYQESTPTEVHRYLWMQIRKNMDKLVSRNQVRPT